MICVIEKREHDFYDQYLYITKEYSISLASPCIWTANKWEILYNKVRRFDTREEAEDWIANRIGVSHPQLRNLRDVNDR